MHFLLWLYLQKEFEALLDGVAIILVLYTLKFFNFAEVIHTLLHIVLRS